MPKVIPAIFDRFSRISLSFSSLFQSAALFKLGHLSTCLPSSAAVFFAACAAPALDVAALTVLGLGVALALTLVYFLLTGTAKGGAVALFELTYCEDYCIEEEADYC